MKIKLNEKLNSKRKDGITLVALVITIVILIILATVTINVAFRDGGFIQRTQQAKEVVRRLI